MKLLSKLRAFGGLTLPTSTAPTPDPGEYAVYFKSDRKPYYKGDDGVEKPFISSSSTTEDGRFIGEVTMFFGAKTDIPDGWLAMDGASFSSSEYPLLASVLGGNILPNMADRTVVGVSTTKALGTVGGSSSATIASHSHSASGLSTGSARNFGGEARGTSSGSNFNTYPKAYDEAHDHNVTGSTGSAGSQTIDIQNPYLALWYIIKAR